MGARSADRPQHRRLFGSHEWFWDLTAKNPRRALKGLDRPVADPAVDEQIANDKAVAELHRKTAREAGELRFGMNVGAGHHVVSWDDRIGRWRQDALAIWSAALFRPREAMRDYYDYLSPFLRLGSLDSAAFAQFFLHEIDHARLPRSLIGGLMAQYQLERRVSRSNHADGRHATHLLDVDLFATADARMYDCLVEVRQHVPVAGQPVRFNRETVSLLSDLNEAAAAFRLDRT